MRYRRFLVLRRDPGVCLKLFGPILVSSPTVDALEAELLRFAGLTMDDAPVILSFARVQLISKRMVSAVLRMQLALARRGRRLYVCDCGPEVAELLYRLRLGERVLEIHETLESALDTSQSRLRQSATQPRTNSASPRRTHPPLVRNPSSLRNS